MHFLSNAMASRDNTSLNRSAIAADAGDGRFRFRRPPPDPVDIMKYQENAVYDALQRAGPFLDENAAALSGADFTADRERLSEVVTSFSTHALKRDVNTRGAIGETTKQRQLRFSLRSQQMEPIAVIARQTFHASARGMADTATVHKDTLVAHGLPATHLDDLEAGIVKLEMSIRDREKERPERAGATKGLAVEEKNVQTISIVSSRRSDLEQITAENHTAAEITTRRLEPHVICHTRILCRHQVRKHQRSDARCLRHPPDIFRRRVM